MNFEESRPRQAQSRKSARSRSKAPAEGSDSDLSVKSTRSTRSMRSTKNTRSTPKSKGKARAQSEVEEAGEEGAEEDMATPVQSLKKSKRSVAPPKSTKARKLATESVESESSEVPPPPPPKLPRSTVKSRRKVIESESEDWQSAQEHVAPTPRPSTTKKAKGRPPKATKTPKALPKPPPVPPSLTPTSNVSASYMSESELRIPMREDFPKPKKPVAKVAAQPFHEKPGNQNRALAESRTQLQSSSRLLSIGSKENANDRNAVVIDASDDEDDTRQFVASKSTVYNSTSSNPPKANGVSTSVTHKPKSTMAKKRESFIGVVLSSSPRITHQSTKAHGEVAERSRVDTDVDEATALDQPSRSAETDRDSPVAVDKGKVKATTILIKPNPPSPTSKHKQKAVVQSEASDSAMEVDDRDDYETQDVQPVRDSRQPSTPRRDPPRKLFGDESNPFTAAPRLDSNDATNPLSVFDVSSGRMPAEAIYALAEEEKEMTVEEWTKRELEIQLELFREHGLRRIREFKERAAEARGRIEAL